MPRKKTQQEFEQEVQELFQGDYVVLGTYINNKTNILIKHNICGNEFMKIPKDMVNKKSGCPFCYGNKSALYNENWVRNNTPYPYKYISGYTAMKEKCKFYCDNCHSEFLQMPSRLIHQHIYGCNCCPTKKKTHEDFLLELGSDTLQHYSINEKYVNADTKINFTHLDCGTSFYLTPEAFLHKFHKQYCPVCYYKKSKGEIIIAQLLTNYDIMFYKEYSFTNLPNRKFDFFLPDLNICIEFDGKQHFESIDFFGGDSYLKKIQQYDNEKNQFCLTNNIALLRIPYSDIDNLSTIFYQIFKEKRSETIEKYKIY